MSSDASAGAALPGEASLGEAFPATVGQRLLWLMSRRAPGLGALNCPLVVRITGALEPQSLAVAVSRLVDRHESLRTVFATAGRGLTQRVVAPGRAAGAGTGATPAAAASVGFREVDLRGEADPRAALEAAMREDFGTPIDPTLTPLRITLWRVGDAEHVLSLNQHHLVTDSWSCGVLFGELVRGYRGEELPAAPRYRDFAAEQERRLRSGELERHRAYWMRQLAGAEPFGFGATAPRVAPDGADETHGAVRPRVGGTAAPVGAATALLSRLDTAELEPALGHRLRGAARSRRTTAFPLLLTAFYHALHQATGRTDLPVGSLLTGRLGPQRQQLVGFVATMVVLRCQWDPAASAATLLRRTQETVTGALAYQELPHHLLPASTSAGAGAGRLDDVVFQLLPDPGHRLPAGPVEFELLVPEAIGSRFGIELAIAAHGEGYRALLFTRRDWVDDAWGPALLARLRGALLALLDDPDAPLPP